MKTPKVLVIEHEEQTRIALDEVLSAMGYKYDTATNLAQARAAMSEDGHALILLGGELPARPGGTPRMQNVENFLDETAEMRKGPKPPVVLMIHRRPEADEEDKLRWAGDMRARGVRTFLCKPFRTVGRTPDRVIKKLLAGQSETVTFARSAAAAVPPARTSNIEPLSPLPAGLDTPPRAASGKGNPPAGSATPDVAGKQPAKVVDQAWPSVPNEPIELDEFMANFCESRSREIRMYRKRALLAAARHGTVTLPPLAGPRKKGQSCRYFTHDLLAAWPGFVDQGVDVPPLLAKPAFGGQADDGVH